MYRRGYAALKRDSASTANIMTKAFKGFERAVMLQLLRFPDLFCANGLGNSINY